MTMELGDLSKNDSYPKMRDRRLTIYYAVSFCKTWPAQVTISQWSFYQSPTLAGFFLR